MFSGVWGPNEKGIGLKKREISLVLVVVVFYYGYMRFVYKEAGPTIDISTGKIRGSLTRSRSGRQFYEFLAIPYAKPPVGHLRFEPPQLPDKWEGVRDASRYGAACIQLDIVTGYVYGKEDCLFINVFVPKSVTTSKKLLPVLFFIHGGLFTSGSADVVGADLIMDEEIIFVTFQYRLAALGFLNTGDEYIRGNMGLKDQHLALKWVQENIQKFNGDPSRVTIFGESAGGASVHYHMLSPKSKGLFAKGISQSGTALNMWFLNKSPRPQARKFAQRLNCPTDNPQEMASCLKQVDPYKIIALHQTLFKPPRDQIDLFAPTIESVIREDTFLSAHPIDIINNETFTKVPWIIGVNSEEGLIHSGEIKDNENFMSWAVEDWDEFSSRVLHFDKNPSISRKIRQFYFPDTFQINSTDIFDELTDIFSDRVFFSSNHKTALMHSKHSPVYTYIFSHRGQLDLVPFLLAMRGEKYHIAIDVPLFYIKDWIDRYIWRLDPRKYGVCHGEEMLYQFSVPIVPYHHPSSADYKMSRSFIKSWVDFAYDDHPLHFHNVTWSPVNPKEGKVRYMNMNVKNPGMIDEPWTRRVNFWNSFNLY